MTPSFPTPVGTSSRPRTCTTPIASSSTSAFSPAMPMASSSSYSRPRVHSADADIPMHEDFEDELAVEHMRASPRTPTMDLSSNLMSYRMPLGSGGYAQPHTHMTTMLSFAPGSPDTSSSFARDDPFFRSVTLQPSGPTMQAPSFFAQSARPSSSSPFFASQGSSFPAQGGFAGASSSSVPTMASYAPAQAYAHMSPFGA